MRDDALVRSKLATDPVYQRAYVQEMGRQSFRYFCKHLLGYADLNKEHDALCEFLQHDPATTKLVLMPRYTFKSSLVTIAKSLWHLLCDPNEKLLLYADSTEKAEGFLTGIKNHLLGLSSTSTFRAVCGAWEVDPKRGVWNQSAIVIAPRTQAAVEASIDTAGLETSKVGKHYSRITFDDLVSDKNVTTKDLMDKVEQCYKKALSLLQPSGSVVLAGTRWHFGDLYGRLMAEYKGQAGFALFHRKAEDGGKYFFADIGKESLTPAFLAQKKATQKSRLYSCLYQNEPTSAEDQLFKYENFRFYQPIHNEAWERWVRTLYLTLVLDAIPPPTSDHGDDAAITVVGTDQAHALFLLEARAGRWSPEDQIAQVLALHEHWHVKKVGIETNAFQQMIQTALEKSLMARRAQPSWRPFEIVQFVGRTQGRKESRIEGLEPYHRRGMLHLPGTTFEALTGVYAELAYQMVQFPNSQKDDLLDSLAYHPQIHQAGSETPQQVEYPPTSAAWYEREVWRPQQIKTLKRMPRFQRPPLPQLAFS